MALFRSLAIKTNSQAKDVNLVSSAKAVTIEGVAVFKAHKHVHKHINLCVPQISGSIYILRAVFTFTVHLSK